jgi:cytosine/adenosine deaminase-related metal-dependent hydrolase
MAADIVLFRLDDLGLAGSMLDPVASLCFTTGMHRADTVLVNGAVVVKESRLVNVDERQLFHKANELSAGMARRAAERTKIDFLQNPIPNR